MSTGQPLSKGKSISELDNTLLLYTIIMRDTAPGIHKYGSLLEAFALAKINNTNSAVFF
jgi:hypothetical protein